MHTRQKINLRNAFANNMSTDTKRKAQLSKIIHLGRFLGDLLGILPGLLMKVLPLAENVRALLATVVSSSAVDGAF